MAIRYYLNQCWLIVNLTINFSEFSIKIQCFHSRISILKCHLQNSSHLRSQNFNILSLFSTGWNIQSYHVNTWRTRGLFHEQFSVVVQIWLKICFNVTPSWGIISLQNFAHATAAPLSCHVQHFIAITLLQLGWEQNEISINLNYDGKIVCEIGPCWKKKHSVLTCACVVWDRLKTRQAFASTRLEIPQPVSLAQIRRRGLLCSMFHTFPFGLYNCDAVRGRWRVREDGKIYGGWRAQDVVYSNWEQRRTCAFIMERKIHSFFGHRYTPNFCVHNRIRRRRKRFVCRHYIHMCVRWRVPRWTHLICKVTLCFVV